MKRIILLGATGSIGRSTLDVIRANADLFELAAVASGSKADELARIAQDFAVGRAVVVEPMHQDDPGVRPIPGPSPDGRPERLDTVDVGVGTEGLLRMIRETEADIVVNGISGSAGLAPSVAALESGKDLALANKETVVMAGDLVPALADRMGRRLLPVDSEHASLYYLLDGLPVESVSRLVLTASGGAFRDLPHDALESVTVEQALSHPTWSMGPKITIDSATMANKGLEIIEAVRLFGVPEDRVEVYLHRQSTIHAMVRTTDGSLFAHMSSPDMRVPIQHALTYPEERPCPFGGLDLDGLQLTFEKPDPQKYPALDLARRAARLGGEYTVAYNASNEVAVDAFLRGRITFPQIARVIERSLARGWSKLVTSLEQVYEADRRCRREAEQLTTETTSDDS